MRTIISGRVARLLVVFIVATVRPAFAAEPASRPTTDRTPLVPGNFTRHLQLDGKDRSFLIHVPPGYNPKKPTPVVLIYHGAFMNGGMMILFCGMNAKSDAAGFVAVYPNGVGMNDVALFFNAFTPPKPGGPADDVAFTAKLLDDLATVMCVDAKRVFATGMSNGGMMCYRLAAELSDRIAAIAPVAGTIAIPESHPKRPVPVIHFHGKADTIVPYGGPDPKKFSLIHFSSVEESIATWVSLDGCPKEPKVTQIADQANDGTTAERKEYGPGKDGSEVVLYSIEGAGHTWPGRPSPLKMMGASTKNVSANDLIWEFFEKHPMK